MSAANPEELVQQLDQAFNRADIEAILEFYEQEAVMVIVPGRLARGKEELRKTFEWILRNLKGTAQQEKSHVIETGDLALFTSKWRFTGTTADGASVSRESYASVVMRRSPQGKWRIVVDNSWGPEVLG